MRRKIISISQKINYKLINQIIFVATFEGFEAM